MILQNHRFKLCLLCFFKMQLYLFGHNKHAWKCPDISPGSVTTNTAVDGEKCEKYSGLITTNMPGNFQTLIKKSWFCLLQTRLLMSRGLVKKTCAWKCPQVSLKISRGVSLTLIHLTASQCDSELINIYVRVIWQTLRYLWFAET